MVLRCYINLLLLLFNSNSNNSNNLIKFFKSVICSVLKKLIVFLGGMLIFVRYLRLFNESFRKF